MESSSPLLHKSPPLAILQVYPLRSKNLSKLHAERDLQRPGNGHVFLAIAEDPFKNSQPIEFELPPYVRKMLDTDLASEGGYEKVSMIDATYLEAHRTASSLWAIEGTR